MSHSALPVRLPHTVLPNRWLETRSNAHVSRCATERVSARAFATAVARGWQTHVRELRAARSRGLVARSSFLSPAARSRSRVLFAQLSFVERAEVPVDH
jgi:hypothetical protein